MPTGARCPARRLAAALTLARYVRHAVLMNADQPEVRIAEVTGHADRAAAAALLAEIWGVPVAETPVPIDLMVAFTHAGGCVLGAWVDDALIGVTVGFAGAPGSDRIYSYIAGVTRGFAGAGVGRQLKLAQRDWALQHAARYLVWTYDPLIRRNAHFNLNRLGGRVVDFVPDFYPEMSDAVNAGDLPDRFVVEWTLTEPVGGRPLPDSPAGAPVLLAPTAKGEPGVNRELLASLGDESSETAPPALRVWVPSDIEGLRASDPAMGRRWRLAAREVFTALFEAGYRTRAVDRDGHYVFTREA